MIPALITTIGPTANGEWIPAQLSSLNEKIAPRM